MTSKNNILETDDDQKALNKARERRSVFNFGMVNIPAGSTLQFVRDENITCTVLDNRRMSLNGEGMSITRAAQIILDHDRPIQGPLYWEYEGETLVERRLRMEQEG